MRKPTSERRTRPDKFPLTLHKTGQYCKKIEGKMYYFGADRPQALARHLEQAAWLHSGRLATYWSAAGQLWAKTMCNLYLNHQESRVPVGQSPATARHGVHRPAATDRRRLVRIHDLRPAPSASRGRPVAKKQRRNGPEPRRRASRIFGCERSACAVPTDARRRS